ncbi:MAG: helix-turn-helix transcriptional regulator, partial [Rhodoferax sp.]|nr:helix-turn-helix transcriptional regulator [Rhodoferax sp.]
RWSVLLIAAALLGLNHFDEFCNTLTISSAVLAQRLQRLCELQLMQKQSHPADARRTQYRLTTAGQDLMAYLVTLNAWGMRGQAVGARSSLQWRHRVCDRLSLGHMTCSHCEQSLLPQQVFGTCADQASGPLPMGVRQTSPSAAQPRKRRRVSANASQKLLPA